MGLSSNTTPMVEVMKSDIQAMMDRESDSDFEFARDNLRDLIASGKTTIDEIMNIARGTESPRAYEVVANLMKTLLDANKDLLDIRKKHKEIQGTSGQKDQPASITNNAVFVGTTDELLEKVLGKSKNG